jgi:co-chaperonin GroES (HSP10)
MIRPNGDRVAVAPIYDPSLSASGLLIIPEEAKDRCDQGIVKYRGPDVTENIQIGDHVSFSGYTGTTIRLGSGHGDYESDEILIMVPEPFLVCKIMGPVTSCPGLYFKSGDVEQVDVVARIVYKISKLVPMSDEMAGEVMGVIIDELRDNDKYFEATHEKVIEHIAWLVSSDKTHREKFGIRDRSAKSSANPTPAEYAKGGLR